MKLRLDAGVFYRSGLTETVETARGTFEAFLDTAEADVFNEASISTHSLRYQSNDAVLTGEVITVDGLSYKVIGLPRRINSGEYTADLVKQ